MHTSDTRQLVRVVVPGAGYGGLLAAIRLAAKSPRADVTLIGESDLFVAKAGNRRIRLLDVRGGQHDQPGRRRWGARTRLLA